MTVEGLSLCDLRIYTISMNTVCKTWPSALCLVLMQRLPSSWDLEQVPTLDLGLSLPSRIYHLPEWQERWKHWFVRCTGRAPSPPGCLLCADASD